MATLFNQTNLNSGTSFAAGGVSGSNFTNGIAISESNANTRYVGISPLGFWNQPILTVSQLPQVASSITTGIMANPFFAYYTDGVNLTSQKSGSYEHNQIKYQGSNGSGNGTVFLNVNDTQLGTQTLTPFQLAGISSMQSGTFVVNSQKMFSTLIGLNYA